MQATTTLERLIPLDSAGIMGPALALTCLSKSYSSRQLELVIKILQENFTRLTKNHDLKGRKEFIGLVEREETPSVQQIVQSKLFKNMQAREPLPSHYQAIEERIGPSTISSFQAMHPAFAPTLNNQDMVVWIARTLANYMTPKQVEDECKCQDLFIKRTDIKQNRMAAGREIYSAAKSKNLTKNDFILFIECLKKSCAEKTDPEWYRSAEALSCELLAKAHNAKEVCCHVYNYLTLFASAGEDAEWFGPYICNNLNTIFKDKLFPDTNASDLMPIDPRSGTGAVLALFFRGNSYTPDQLKTVAQAAKRNYTFLSGKEVHGRKAFCDLFDRAKAESRTVSIQEIISSQMFKEMQPEEKDAGSHELAVKYLVPAYLKGIPRYMPEVNLQEISEKDMQEMTECIALLLESFMTKKDIVNECKLKEFLSQHPEMERARADHGKKIYDAAANGDLTEASFNAVVNTLGAALSTNSLGSASDELPEGLSDSDAKMAKDFVSAYASLFEAAGPENKWVGEHLLKMLSNYFRLIFFQGSE